MYGLKKTKFVNDAMFLHDFKPVNTPVVFHLETQSSDFCLLCSAIYSTLQLSILFVEIRTGALLVAPCLLFHITSSRSSKSLYNLLTLLKSFDHLCLYIYLPSQLQKMIDVDWYADRCWLIVINTDWFWLMLVDSDWCWLVLIDSDRCWLVLIIADWCWLMLIDANWSWLMLIDMLTDADWFWLMLIDSV